MGPLKMVSFPYYSHTTPIRIRKDMGIVWETYHKGVPLLGVPGITLEITWISLRGGFCFKALVNHHEKTSIWEDFLWIFSQAF